MLKRMNGKEMEISDLADRKSFRFKKVLLGYVYFVYHQHEILYIGCTMNPFTREMNHRANFSILGFNDLQFVFVGPFEYQLATKIESYEISNAAKKSIIINKSGKKVSYGEEFSIKNYRQKSISLITKGGKNQKVVSEYPC